MRGTAGKSISSHCTGSKSSRHPPSYNAPVSVVDQVLGQPQCHRSLGSDIHRTKNNPMNFLLMAKAELPLAERSITEGRTRAPVPLSAVTWEAQHSGGAVTPR